MFEEAKWIWAQDVSGKDSYAEFVSEFGADAGLPVRLYLSCDSNYSAWVNGKLAGFGQCADFPHRKLYDKIDLTDLCGKSNQLKIVVWHYGEDSQTYINSDAKLIFEIVQGEKVLLSSGEHILSRRETHYRNGYCKQITSQLGYSFLYDATEKNERPFLPSVPVRCDAKIEPRRLAQLKMRARPRVKITPTEQGFLVDMGKETAGFLDLAVESPRRQKIVIVYGEHLREGKVPRLIGDRDFSVEYVAAEGENEYVNTFRRLAGRYLEIFAEKGTRLRYAGIRPVDYPVRKQEKKFDDPVFQKIYDVSVYTLRQCMHEHYEDCPWREQAFYTMDSRNQMLCGYHAFRGHRYQRENLITIAQGVRPHGLLSLCFPGGRDHSIPFFSLVYIMQVSEYVRYTGDVSVIPSVRPAMDRILATFASWERNGLVPNPVGFWNFYEWSEYSSGNDYWSRENQPDCYDLILNCMYVYVRRIYAALFGLSVDTSASVQAIEKTFYCKEEGLYRLSTKEKHFSRLGNAFALLIGLGGEELAEKVAEGKGMIPVTLSMTAFVYDALLLFGDKYKNMILEDIKTRYSAMLAAGATTFWETEKGWEDFGGAGSLCHGWSAIPVYYLCRLLLHEAG